MITVNVEEPEAMSVEIGEVTEVKEKISLQEKSIIPTKSLQNVTADEGFDGLSAVNIDPIPDEYVIQNLQEKTIIPTKSAQDVTADEDYTGLSVVHVEPIPDDYVIQNLQEKTVTPSDSEQSITADDGYTGLSSVTVEKIAKPFIDSSKFTSFYCMFSRSYGNSDISVLENLDTSNGTNFSYMFYGNENVVNLSLDTHNGKDFQYFCSGCGYLRNVTKLDVSNANTTFAMFHLCYSLQTIPELNTVNVKDFRSMFYGCQSGLTTIPSINLSNGEKYSNMFYGCKLLSSITFDGTVNICSNDLSFAYCPLTEESLASLVNALSDNSGMDKTYTVTIGADNIAKLTEEQLASVAAKNINLA